ncbi:SMI1/KNR4 family protein [Streptomyces sp. NBC_01410]|uniref:hypothetical protein n=1 Tax=Streptomyces sp. NBC_01410 TaxID=2903856 RepID=UPI0032496274
MSLSFIHDLLGEVRRDRLAPAGAWSALEQIIGVDLPSDYKEFVDGYGEAMLFDHLYVPHPMSSPSLAEFIESENETLREVFEPDSDMPERVRESWNRMIPWAYHNWDGDTCVLLPPVEGDGWRVAVAFRQYHRFKVFDGDFSDFLRGILKLGEFPPGWPTGGPLWRETEDGPLVF